jgi:diadenosine tetraphosphate (Ap4A) HIT family hydrolase
MNDCYFCNMIEKNEINNLIIENDHAFATGENYFREGHCTVVVKKHIESISDIESDEYFSVFDLIKKVSKALEKKYDCEKTYLLSIGDEVNHLHFHLIPKLKDKSSMGVYCFQKLVEEEGKPEPSDSEKRLLVNELKNHIKML